MTDADPPRWGRPASAAGRDTRRTRPDWRAGPWGSCSISNSTLLSADEAIEVERGVEAAAMEEVFLLILGGDEAEAAVGDDLLDGTGGHEDLQHFPNRRSRAHGPFEKGVDHAELLLAATISTIAQMFDGLRALRSGDGESSALLLPESENEWERFLALRPRPDSAPRSPSGAIPGEVLQELLTLVVRQISKECCT